MPELACSKDYGNILKKAKAKKKKKKKKESPMQQLWLHYYNYYLNNYIHD